MSQKGVEGLIGRLVTDRDLRRRFFQEPAGICANGRFDVTVREIEAILALEEAEVEEFSRKLDSRIVRARTDGGAGADGSRDLLGCTDAQPGDMPRSRRMA